MLDKAFNTKHHSPVLGVIMQDVNEILSRKLRKEPSFLELLTHKTDLEECERNQRYWNWLIDLYNNAPDDANMLVITRGSPRTISNYCIDPRFTDEFPDRRFFFEYRGLGQDFTLHPPCECARIRDTELERTNKDYDTVLQCQCLGISRGYFRRLVDHKYPADRLKLYPYFNRGLYLYDNINIIYDVIGTITVGYKPLSNPRVKNIELTATFPHTEYWWMNHAKSLREWITQYNPNIKAHRGSKN
jgi:hypothetical protein